MIPKAQKPEQVDYDTVGPWHISTDNVTLLYRPFILLIIFFDLSNTGNY